MEKLIESWAKKNPKWEIRYEDLIKSLCDYGRGTSQYSDLRGKTFGAGYELYIVAFFLGLYMGKTRPLVKDAGKVKDFGQPIMYWGSIENRLGRKSYSQIQNYIFAALIAKTDIDMIALEKDEISSKKVVDQLLTTMEEYANYGFHYLAELQDENPDCLFKDASFLNLFMDLMQSSDALEDDDDTPDSLG